MEKVATTSERRKKREMRRRRRNRIILIFIAVLVIGGVIAGAFAIRGHLQDKSDAKKAEDVDAVAAKADPLTEFLDLNHLNSKNAILVNAADGTIRAEKDCDTVIYPASMTKIMTAIVVIENVPDLYEVISIPSDIFDELAAKNAATAGFKAGEEVRVIDLLYGALLPSGAECCLALANRVSGSEEAFAELMNEKAAQLGMTHTQFRNTTGLHDDDHYTTVKEMAELLRYSIENEAFKAIFTEQKYVVPATNMHPDGMTLNSSLFWHLEGGTLAFGRILGGKTGYTGQAGQCLASLAKVNGKEYILVTAGAGGTPRTEQEHIQDAVDVYNQTGKVTLAMCCFRFVSMLGS